MRSVQVLVAVALVFSLAQGQQTVRASVSTGGGQGNGRSSDASVSADGRFVAFTSEATNLVPGDTNGHLDVFVHDLELGTTECVSFGGNGDSQRPSISEDGRFVAFWGTADNLVPGDTNGTEDVFVRDRVTGSIEWVSRGGNGPSGNPAISADGRYVAFASFADNLAPGDMNGYYGNDIFVRDRIAGTTERVTGGLASCNWPSISPDGRFVGYNAYRFPNSGPGNIRAMVYDRQTGIAECMCPAADGLSLGTSISEGGRYVAFQSTSNNIIPGNPNPYGYLRVYVRDRLLGTIERADVDSYGVPGDGGSDFAPAISWDGRDVVFDSSSTNLVPGWTGGGVFLHDRIGGRTHLESVRTYLTIPGDGNSFNPSISGDCQVVAFTSDSQRLVPNDTNGVSDVFVRFR